MASGSRTDSTLVRVDDSSEISFAGSVPAMRESLRERGHSKGRSPANGGAGPTPNAILLAPAPRTGVPPSANFTHPHPQPPHTQPPAPPPTAHSLRPTRA